MEEMENKYIIVEARVFSIDETGHTGNIIVEMTRDKDDTEKINCAPLLPKILKVYPKVGEYVYILLPEVSGDNKGKRYYIGPIGDHEENLSGRYGSSLAANITEEKSIPKTVDSDKSVFAKYDETAIYNRTNSELILGDDGAILRSGVRQEETNKITLNRDNPSYVLVSGDLGRAKSSVSLVADTINLIGNQGKDVVIQTTPNEGTENNKLLDTEQLEYMRDFGHTVAYGDKIVEILVYMLKLFKNHYHRYCGMGKVPYEGDGDTIRGIEAMIEELQKDLDENQYLSSNIRIN